MVMPYPPYNYPMPVVGIRNIYPFPPLPEELELMYQMRPPIYYRPIPHIYPDYYPYY